MVECEYSHQTVDFTRFSVLIDTWWNVNFDSKWKFIIAFIVLIDTWWNVNDGSDLGKNDRLSGFNRYMVECELFWSGGCDYCI